MSDLVYLKNLMTDPRCTRKRDVWSNISGTTVHQRDDGLYQYNGPSDGVLAIFVWGSNSTVPPVQDVSVGDVVFAKFTPVDDFRDVESATIVLSGDGWVAARRNILTNLSLRFINGASVTLERCAHYTPETWEKVREMYETGSLELPYFDYKTMPLGGGVFVLALSLLVLSALSGGWRHERGAFLYSERGTRSPLPESQEHVQVRNGSGRGRGVDVFVHELGDDIPVTRYPGRGRGRGDGGGTGLRRAASIRRVRHRRDPGIGLDACRAPVHGAAFCRDRGGERRSGGELPAAQGRRVRRTLVAAGQISQGERWPAIARDRLEHDARPERLMLGVVA